MERELIPLAGITVLEALMTKFVTLLVEDDTVQRKTFAELLKGEGFEVIECSTAEAAELVVATSGANCKRWLRIRIWRVTCRARSLPVMPLEIPGYERYRRVRPGGTPPPASDIFSAKTICRELAAQSSPRRVNPFFGNV